MKKVRVPLWQQPRSFATVEDGATAGAVVGRNVYNPDGSLFVPATAATPAASGLPVTLWRLVQEIPANVSGLAAVTTDGWFRKDGAAIAAREIADTDLPLLPDSGTGAGLVKITRDAYGRVEGTEVATTDDLTEGATNLYHTDARAREAARSESRIAATALGGHRVVRSTSATHIDLADSSNATHGDDTLGITTGAAAAGAAIAVITRGQMVEPSWAWTPGDPVFLSGAGLLTQTPPPSGFVQVVGFAESATAMFIDIQPPIYFD